MPHGAFRRVVLLGPVVLKLPRWRTFLGGRCSNRWEREMWRLWQPVFGWNNLCPIVAADAFGMFVVMRRAEQPVSQQEVDDADPDDYPAITAETKADDYGRLGARIVAVDYGLPDEGMIRERRAYYQDMAKRRNGS